MLGPKTLLDHVTGRLAPQVDQLRLSVQHALPSEYTERHPCVPDKVASHRGPLMGLYSVLSSLEGSGPDWLVLCPCDAPFLPADLVERLQVAVRDSDLPVAAARYQGTVQPTFSLWYRDMLAPVRDVVLDQGKGGLMAMLDRQEHAVVDWPATHPPPFFNINTPADLDAARSMLDGPADGH